MASTNGITWDGHDCINAEADGSVRYLLSEYGVALCVVHADCRQGALELAADADRLERFEVNDAANHESPLMALGTSRRYYDLRTLRIDETEANVQSAQDRLADELEALEVADLWYRGRIG